MKSQPITISRYSNGTLVKLNVTDSAFVSYDYNPETDAATYIPNTITITPTFSGGVKFGSWRYSTDGATFQNIVSGQHGFTISGGVVILAATSDLYKTTNSAVIVACVGDDPTYFDTVTIMRYVDPTFVYKKTSTAIKQTNDKISLIATEEQLEKYGQNFTVLDDVQAQIELTSQSITSSVSKTYQTKSDAEESLQTLKTEIKQTTDEISSTVSKKVGESEIISKINQSPETIKINANKVNITGFVTFDNLKNSSETIINGSNITTGTIHDANNNMVLDLSTGAITAKKLSVTSTYFTLLENGYCYWGGTTGSKIGIENGIIKGYWNNEPTGSYIDCTSSRRIRASRFFVSEGATSDLHFHQVATTTETVVTSVFNGNDTKGDVIGSVSFDAGSCTARTTTIYYKNQYNSNDWTTVVTGINYRAPSLLSSSKSVVTASGKASSSTKTIRVFQGAPTERHLVVDGGIVTTFA